MARKKSQPQQDTAPNIQNDAPVEAKKGGRKKNKVTSPDNNSQDETNVTGNISSSDTREPAAPAEVSGEAKPAKKTAKKTTPKPKTKVSEEDVERMLPEPDNSAVAPLAGKQETEPGPVKKAGRPKTSATKETPATHESPEPQKTPADTTSAIENTAPVSVSEEKNDAFIHKLVHAAEHVLHTPAEDTTDNDKKAITFIVNYYTKPGQQIYITGSHPMFGNGNPDEALLMAFLDRDHWKAEVSVSKNDLKKEISYNYLLKEKDGSVVFNGGKDKQLSLSLFSANKITVADAWDFAGYYDNAFFTEPFTNVLLQNNYTPTKSVSAQPFTHEFNVKAPLLLKGQVVCLTGNTDALKNWDVKQPFLLQKDEAAEYWSIRVNLGESHFPLYYKYGVFDVNKKQLIQLENGDNRVLNNAAADAETIVNDGFMRTSDNTWKGAGVAVPVFSLRTNDGFGCGEFADIKKLADWCKQVGIKLIQILPVNDTTATKTWHDSYPYASISAFALHPMYLNVDALANEENKSIIEKYRDEASQLNALATVNYEGVNDLKWKIIHEIYPLQKDATFATADYQSFFKTNKHWLLPYAAFCSLRDEYNTSDFTQWNDCKIYDEQAVANRLQYAGEADRAGMYYFVQYHLHLQLKAASEYANNNGIIIKGDIAIGVARHSADAWQHPGLFHLDRQAGAPPDAFAVKGQNWGFPTYNWQKMKENGFAWWKQRFLQMSYYFDAFRIDHILGFFRIWSIPEESVEGIMGHFVPAIPVHVNEFHQWNTYFDLKRYCNPFINDQIINDLFGDRQDYARNHFFNKQEDGTYSLKTEVATQKRVETYFAIQEPNADNNWQKQTLFDLISNVILFEEKGSDGMEFHFRFGMEKTLSYQYLDDYTKKQLYYLSVNYFYERQDEFWRREALQKLPALKQETDMLICGEDLGMVPATVPRVMRDLGLLSLEVQRMPKDEKTTFVNLETAPYLSVVTPATHDMSTIRGWWEEDRNTTQNFYNNFLGHGGEAPVYCEPWINRQIVEQHLYSPAMWSIFQLQDLMGIDGDIRRKNPQDERINVPAIPNYYWNYRVHLSLEDLMEENNFNSELKETIVASGR